MNWLEKKIAHEQSLAKGRDALWLAIRNHLLEVIGTYNQSFGKIHGEVQIESLNAPTMKLSRPKGSRGGHHSEANTAHLEILISDDGAILSSYGDGTSRTLRVEISDGKKSLFAGDVDIDAASRLILENFLLKISKLPSDQRR